MLNFYMLLAQQTALRAAPQISSVFVIPAKKNVQWKRLLVKYAGISTS